MRRPTVLFFFVLSACAWAKDEWLAVYLHDKKIGYSSYKDKTTESGKYAESVSVLDGKMLGFGLTLSITSRTWSDKAGLTKRMEFDLESGGRLQKVIAVIEGSSIKASSETDGRKTEKSIPVPSGATIVDDPLTPFVDGGNTKDFYVFDPNTLELVRCQPEMKPKQKIQTAAGETEATVIELHDPRAPMTVYLTAKGDLIKAIGPFGMEMRPVTKAVALASSEPADIGLASSIKPDREIEDFYNVKHSSLMITGHDLSNLPSDSHQTVRKEDKGWLVDIHPLQPENVKVTDGASPDPKWLAPDIHVPCDEATYKSLAKNLTKGSKGLLERAEKIRQFVHSTVQANAGIGVLRDADDILKSGEGVCRDHAILMATILRADGIPTRLVSGLVYGLGAFYYHAWVEVWTGDQWLGLDSTRPSKGLDATHIKIGQGTVGEAFTSFLLDGARITVVKP